ncbi:MAG: MFS transporter [Candidatus Marinimicrobia bacterium]|nr:MFS transporter [FCB group bacterium]MBL7023963.1 MFS transporter [Candidatus Neomarinimicrobiota bacterium]
MLSKNALKTKNGRLLAFSLLYLSEGIPFGFSAIALATHLRMSGVGLTEIGLFTASLYAPWGLKWAWAPLVDLIEFKRFGSKRTWIAGAQAAMIGTLGIVVFFDYSANIQLLTTLIVIHNIFAATQDVAIDALAIKVLPENERGIANGFMFGSSYLGQAIGGSGALLIAGKFGFALSFPFVLLMLILILFFVTLRLQEPASEVIDKAVSHESVAQEIINTLKQFFKELFQGFFKSGTGPIAGVIFSLLPFGALALGLVLGSALQVDLGMDENQIAKLTMLGTIFAASGCVLGGWISDRVGHRKALGAWYVLTTIPTFFLARQFTGIDGTAGVTIDMFFYVSIAYSFASGLVQGTSTAVFMGLTSPAVAATQFTGYMALHNFVYSYSSLWQGKYADLHGYAKVLFMDGWIAFIPLILLPFLKPRKQSAEST